MWQSASLSTGHDLGTGTGVAVAAAKNAVTSPMVGTVYLSPEPGAKAFVSVGDKVKKEPRTEYRPRPRFPSKFNDM